MAALVVSELTAATLTGTGVFDVLMRSVKTHLDGEFTKGRIKGPEYSTVYLGSLDLAMQTSLQFVLQQRKNDLEAQLLSKQIELINQQIISATAEALNVPKQGLLLDAQKAQVVQQTANAALEAQNIPKQGQLLDTQKAQIAQQTINAATEKLGIEAKTALTVQQKANAILEAAVLVAQECKLRAEFDNTVAQTLKSNQELALLAQKVATEKAQITALGVDADSVVGKQKALYTAQTDGFKRDAEQKAAKLMADTWSVRRTTDEATVADGTNLLNDVTVGRAITKMLTGVGA